VTTTSDRELSEFLLRACHDFRASLRTIRTHTELLRRDEPSSVTPQFDQHLEFILGGARKLDLLTSGLSAYSIALQIDEASFQPTRMDLVVRNALAKLDKEVREQGAEITFSELPRVSGNPDRLAQIFDVLLRNALRYRTESPPRIQITASKQDDKWLFAVRDNGPGIDAQYFERVFQPFETLQTRDGESAGMGLAICRTIVEKHGGKIRVESEPGAGSTFLFTLPASER
jgi:light-regulated signal transduction histidine kinase (bacteriophytochrome)